MISSDELERIIERIEQRQQTNEDMEILRQRLLAYDQRISTQLGKYNVNIVEGKDIHIGDSTYYSWDDEAIRALVKAIRSADKFPDVESIKSKIREKQTYCQNKIRELDYQKSQELRQLESECQNNLISIEAGYQHNLRSIEIDHQNRRKQEINRLIIDLTSRVNQLEPYLEELEENWSKANSGYPASSKVNNDYSELIIPLRKDLFTLRNDIEVLRQGKSDSLSASTRERISDFDRNFSSYRAKLGNDTYRIKNELKVNLNKNKAEIEKNTATEIKKIEQNGRSEIYSFIIRVYLSKEKYPFSQKTIDDLKQFQSELKMPREEIETIEESEIKPYYEKNQREYQEEFTKIITAEHYPVSDISRRDLKQKQKLLGLKDRDVEDSEQKISEPYYRENLHKYEQQFIELIKEEVRELTKESIDKLKFQQNSLKNRQKSLGLKSEDVKDSEQRIIKQYYQASLDKYEQEFTQLIDSQDYYLNHETENNFIQRQQFLGINVLGFNLEDILIVQRTIKNYQGEDKAIDYLSSNLFKEDYQKLRNSLASTKWKDANEETKNILFRLAKNRNKEYDRQDIKKITEGQIKTIDLLPIMIIDLLWDVYSKGRFSFHKQRDIFITAGKDYKAFSENIGWKKRAFFILDFLSWKSDKDIVFNIDAPEGHLPFWRTYIINSEQFLLNLIDLNYQK